MRKQTAARQHRAAVRWIIAFLVYLVFSLVMWWLVARTNSQGDHDAELLPLLSLIPLAIGLYHLHRSHRLAETDRASSPGGPA